MITHFWVVDTNVVVAGILTGDFASPPAQILERMLSGELRFVLSVELLGEYRRVLLRPHIRSRHGLSEKEIDSVLEALTINGAIVDIQGREETAPDPGDNHLWRLLAARVGSGLITGDALLVRKPPPRSRVLSPAEWLEEIAK